MIARSIDHVPGLDGLRGLAVIAVVLFHSKGLLRDGYLGVDLFFVLSGYLITSILLAEHRRTGRIDLRAFWVRRARRLLPALLAMVPFLAVYAGTLATSAELEPLRADALATLGYVANWRSILARRSYWEMFSAPSPLEHTWSLSIEEQFYVVWPLVVVAILTRGGKARGVLAVSLLLAAASALAMTLLFDGGDTTRVYLGTDTRGAAILIGCALASLDLERRTARRTGVGVGAGILLDVGGIASLGLLAWAWGCLDGQDARLYRGVLWLTELAVVVLIACTVHRSEGVVARLLSLRPFRAVGAVSYGVYLWHWPVFVVFDERRVHHTGIWLLAIRLVVTLSFALASYRWVEVPIRSRGLVGRNPLFVVPAAFAMAVFVVFISTRARSSRSLVQSRPKLAFTSHEGRWFPPSSTFPEELPPLALRVLVLGDSVGISLGNRMYWAQGSSAFVVQRSVGDCSILDSVAPVRSLAGRRHDNFDCSKSWADDVAELLPDVTLVLLGGAFFSTVKLDGRWRSVCEAPWHDAFVASLVDRVRAITPRAGRVVLSLVPAPVGKWESATLADSVACYDVILRDAAAAAAVATLDLASKLCPGGPCATTSRGQLIRPDGLHFDGLGADDTARWVLDELHAEARAR